MDVKMKIKYRPYGREIRLRVDVAEKNAAAGYVHAELFNDELAAEAEVIYYMVYPERGGLGKIKLAGKEAFCRDDVS